ncbi:hypothetical protein E2C01_047917 [Portunus trituberculatus]|uniref:HTH psq-type domain-containing protein n=1 Tax=Portunus trituberculatus TaxID=210409 RepID=A0A5B7G2B2_PORTR|nr:hypothetical protein [Portunus trituberculatus]
MLSSKQPVTPKAGELKNKRPRKSLSLENKLEIVKRHRGANFIARTLPLPQSTVSTIIKQTANMKKADYCKKNIQNSYGI